MKLFYLLFCASIVFCSCSRKWKQPTHCAFTLNYSDDNNSTINEITSSIYYTEFVQFVGSREQAGDINLTQTIDKQIIGGHFEAIEFDLPQGTYTSLDAHIGLSRNSGSAHTLKFNGKHHFLDGSFSNFQFELDSDILISGPSFDSDGTNTIILSKKIDRSATIDFDLNALIDGIPETYWTSANAGSGMIVVDSGSNASLYLYIITNISDYLEVRFL
jgi:hypothetical protein